MHGPGSGTIWRCGPAGGSVPLCAWALSCVLAARKPVLSRLPPEQDAELSASAPCLPGCRHAPASMILNL